MFRDNTREMLKQVLDIFNVIPKYDLAIMQEQQTLYEITSKILFQIREVLFSENPDLVLVHGDTTTTFATALSCFLYADSSRPYRGGITNI